MKKEMIGRPILNEPLTEIQESILRLAHERFLGQGELSFGEILITLYGCAPARMGPLWVQNFSKSELLAACRSEQYDHFHFRTEAEKESYLLDQISALAAVSDLVARELVAETKHPRIIWHSDKPLVKRIEYYRMIRLTEKGKKALGEKRRHPRHSLHLPADCSVPGPGFRHHHSGLALNISEEGLRVDLDEKFDLGQKVRLTIEVQGSIEILARVVWVQPAAREGEPYRTGFRITALPREKIRRLARLLATGSAAWPAPFFPALGPYMSC
jgi:PilZ domain